MTGAIFDPQVEAWAEVVGGVFDGEAEVLIAYPQGGRPTVRLSYSAAQRMKENVAGASELLADPDLVSGQYGGEVSTEEHGHLCLRFDADSNGRVLGLVARSGHWLFSVGVEDANELRSRLSEACAEAMRAADAQGFEL